ncbi:glutathione S-transferase family protein [Klebsiella pneumoniae]|nr:glutathione S-transferase family protein [Klebsiella pneumoniae]
MITLWGRNNSTNVKKVRWVLEELDLPYQQILAGLEFGLNHDPEYLAMNPNGLVPLLKDDATGVVVWESNTIIRYLAAQYGVDRLWLAAPAQRAQGEKWMDWSNGTLSLWLAAPAQRAQGEKWMDWSNGTLSPAHRPVLMGLVRTPPEQRDPAAIAAGISACEALFAMLDDELAKMPWLSGEQFGLGDIAVAPFVYNLLSILDSWQPRPHLQRWYQQISQRPAWREVVQIPVT